MVEEDVGHQGHEDQNEDHEGNPNTEPPAINRKASLNPGMDEPWVMTKAKPVKTPILPKVATKGGIFTWRPNTVRSPADSS